MIRAGLTIDLADATTYLQRRDYLDQQRAQRQARTATAFGDEYRRTHGTGIVA